MWELGAQRWQSKSDKEDVSPSPLTTRRHRALRCPAILALLGALVAVMGTASMGIVAARVASAANWAPVHPGDFPDPSIVYDKATDTYYAFATQNFAAPSQTINIQVSTSTDGVDWTQLNGVDALPTLGSWAKPGETWAPSVAYDSTDSEFVLYYTATENSQPGDQCIGMATSPNPEGPYQDTRSYPIVCQDGVYPSNSTTVGGNYGGSIDPDVFTDSSTGDSWLIWKSDGNHLTPPMSTIIWSVPLGSDLLPSSTDPNPLMQDDEQWQSGVVEGPDMYYLPGNGSHGSGGSYYLFYAGSDEGASTYGIGWASCTGPSGPCNNQSTSSPLLGSDTGMSGPGGPDVFTLPPTGQTTGQLVMAFSAWQGNTIGYLSCGIRPMYLADLSFDPSGGGRPTPTLSPYDPGASPADSPTCPVPPQPPPGYWQVAADGGVFTFGSANFYGSTGSMKLNKPVVGMAPTPDHGGYWLVASDGGVFAFGDADFHGSTGSMILNKPIVGMIPTLDGGGYWLIASDGGVFAFGDASFYGSAGGDGLAYPVTAAAPSFLGGGYWLVDSNGQVFNYGNAPFEGQPVFAPGGYRITGMAGTRDSGGYWLASANGNVADFGNAAPYGSMYGTTLNAPVVGMAATSDAAGYWLQGADGGIFTYGNAPFLGSMGGHPLNAPMVGIAAV